MQHHDHSYDYKNIISLSFNSLSLFWPILEWILKISERIKCSYILATVFVTLFVFVIEFLSLSLYITALSSSPSKLVFKIWAYLFQTSITSFFLWMSFSAVCVCVSLCACVRACVRICVCSLLALCVHVFRFVFVCLYIYHWFVYGCALHIFFWLSCQAHWVSKSDL